MAPPRWPITQRMSGKSRNRPSKHIRATASVVSNGKPTSGPSTYSPNGSACAGSIGWRKMQSFQPVRFLEERPVPGR